MMTEAQEKLKSQIEKMNDETKIQKIKIYITERVMQQGLNQFKKNEK